MTIATFLLASGVVTSWLLRWHLNSGEQGYSEPRQPLSTIPTTLYTEEKYSDDEDETYRMEWKSEAHPGKEVLAGQIAEFADDFIYRVYRPPNGYYASVYAVYSRTGKDRYHHPEVCVRDVAGAPEDASARGLLFLDEDKTRPVQRMGFLSSGARVVIYYWHYTLPLPDHDTRTGLQTIHQKVKHSPPSITVQVTTPAPLGSAVEKNFLSALDGALRQSILPEGAVMGCDRMPIDVIRQ